MAAPMRHHAAHPGGLHRHFGLLHATALNVTMIVGAGVFITIPPMLNELPGPWALLGWLAAGVLVMLDACVWSQLGAAIPGSGGSYVYLLESYGRKSWGRLAAFLFIWQFMISGPLEVGSGLIGLAQFLNYLSPGFKAWNEAHTWTWTINADQNLAMAIGPTRAIAFGLGVVILALLWRNVTALAKVTVFIWLVLLGAIAWVLIDGALHFRASVAFDWPEVTPSLGGGLGQAMILAMYSYLGYYNVCYIGDEVKEPTRTIPRAIFISGALVCVLFTLMHLAMLGTVSWRSVPTEQAAMDAFSLSGEFMRRLHGDWAAALITLCLIWSCFGSVFAALLGYSRIPFGAARYGHFFAALGRVHPVHHIPHVSLLLVGGLTLLWSFFDLTNVISALITTRILEQFVGQTVGLFLLRRTRPDLAMPWRMWLYPLPALLALAGWLYMYIASGWMFILLGLATMSIGAMVFFGWTWRTKQWPFGSGDDAAASDESAEVVVESRG
jgi:amino acid transporter